MIRWLIMFMILTAFTSSQLSLTEVRIAYEKSVYNEQTAVNLLEYLTSSNNPTFLGYKGAVTIVMAKHVMSPYKKFNYFKTGKGVLEQAIQKEPLNVELRFIRFSIQCNAPKFLDYHSNINTDKVLLLKAVKTIKDVDLKKRITKFLLNSSEVNNAEKTSLQK
jgi:hypothetical protein